VVETQKDENKKKSPRKAAVAGRAFVKKVTASDEQTSSPEVSQRQ